MNLTLLEEVLHASKRTALDGQMKIGEKTIKNGVLLKVCSMVYSTLFMLLVGVVGALLNAPKWQFIIIGLLVINIVPLLVAYFIYTQAKE